MYHVSANPDLGGAQRLRELNHQEERTRQHRVPYHVGPNEARFSRVLALFTDTEINSFLSELTADTRCSEEALRQLEETREPPEDLGPARDSLLDLSSPAREALFAQRVELAEAALRRIQPRPSAGGGHPRSARVLRADGTGGDATPLAPVTPPPTLPTPPPLRPRTTPPDASC